MIIIEKLYKRSLCLILIVKFFNKINIFIIINFYIILKLILNIIDNNFNNII